MELGNGAAVSTDGVLDVSHANLNAFSADSVSDQKKRDTKQLYLNNNRLCELPSSVRHFSNLQLLDISNNGLSVIGEDITSLVKLRTLVAKNNRLNEYSLPKNFGSLQLEVLNLSGNRFEEIPLQCTKLRRLQSLSLGGNRLKSIPVEIENLSSLEVLYLGGNFISSIPTEVANLPRLSYLALSDNSIQSVPPQLTRLHSLRSLSLHNNQLRYMPREILSLVRLQELSLRGNPLVVRFVKELMYDPPSLLELAGRAVKSGNVPYSQQDLPNHLLKYLDLASKCPNPKCAGVYFDSCVRHIKFVDFCGKYRLPLMHYLCSPECTASPCSSNPQSDAESDDDSSVPADRLQRVLLG
ncbi:leucine-rich repeat-containing protein 58 [Corythoichthys intestinalis]|uniref:leucine-rich repeat-containing protein 58 n=1 Tax=Corythoichthys intestinalis TaxID=161448 RepID=UPI0025A630A3|nr:leucine-rich repeat-containing protein 58 [Corythoichthys intestinalis]XP_061799966.1 leucine-rich repeat-containing protein 58-like [Nerophis lumbriciformis]